MILRGSDCKCTGPLSKMASRQSQEKCEPINRLLLKGQGNSEGCQPRTDSKKQAARGEGVRETSESGGM